jgi:hypothetical protein
MSQMLFQAGAQGGKDETVKTVQIVRRDVEDVASTVITLERNLK